MEKITHDLASNKNTYVTFDNERNVYEIRSIHNQELLTKIKFQDGPTKEGPLNGVFMEDLIHTCINRLEYFQTGGFRCRENACAITHLEEALMWLDKRVKNRRKRGVWGTSKV